MTQIANLPSQILHVCSGGWNRAYLRVPGSPHVCVYVQMYHCCGCFSTIFPRIIIFPEKWIVGACPLWGVKFRGKANTMYAGVGETGIARKSIYLNMTCLSNNIHINNLCKSRRHTAIANCVFVLPEQVVLTGVKRV